MGLISCGASRRALPGASPDGGLQPAFGFPKPRQGKWPCAMQWSIPQWHEYVADHTPAQPTLLRAKDFIYKCETSVGRFHNACPVFTAVCRHQQQ